METVPELADGAPSEVERAELARADDAPRALTEAIAGEVEVREVHCRENRGQSPARER